MKIAIRVDGDSGKEAGMGHVYRSLAIAQFLQNQLSDLDVYFLMRNFPEGLNKVEKAGYSIIRLPQHPQATHLNAAFAQMFLQIIYHSHRQIRYHQ